MRLAEPAPAACSACHLSQPNLRHVDFQAAYDGPMFPGGVAGADGEITDAVPVSIDDLIICERCLCAAAAHVGLSDPGEMLAELEQLHAANQTIAEKVRGLEQYIGRLEAAIAAKPGLPATRKRERAAA
jgi:hypothetical protein